MLKGAEKKALNKRKASKQDTLFKLTNNTRRVFHKLREAFKYPPLLIYFNPSKEILLATDASGFTIAGILL